MELREIQRLHAKYAPDAMTIDLPRQIAALPAPVSVEADTGASRLTSRLSRTRPLLRRCTKPVAIAVLIALAGVGAGRIYHAVGTNSASQPNREEVKARAREKGIQPIPKSEPAVRPIHASPAQPTVGAPPLSASDLGAPEIGLTADQFRDSLHAPTAIAPAAKAAAASSNESALAAASPIRQTHHELNGARQAATAPTNLAQASAPVQAPATMATTNSTQAAPPSVIDRAAPSIDVPARQHGSKHHTQRARDDQSGGSDAAPATSNKKPASARRAGSNEVQMF
ncbi:hypothetical protein [Caballeronia sp. LZ043]|uniref:hypothetical protein n=1 Tax=Caballeronia sp. LZ043 TaxID=3038569 RepID=UPI00285AD436|nr:hypothetical protein [Caballeronia sp. LZ043]MDR5826092.1 hypothetical protein [Caballeronia sp. LZ043]